MKNIAHCLKQIVTKEVLEENVNSCESIKNIITTEKNIFTD